MKLFRILFIIGISCFFSLNVLSQNNIPEEWVDMDVATFQQFFQTFPPKSETTLDELKLNSRNLKQASKDSIGFEGSLYDCRFIGGTISIYTTIVSYKNRIVKVEANISNTEFSHLNRVFNRDSSIRTRFEKLFALKTFPRYPLKALPHHYKDSCYQYTYTNHSLFEEYKNHVAEYLGKQATVSPGKYKLEYDFLNNPTGNYEFSSSYFKTYRPVYAMYKLKKANKIDCIKNIIRGYSLSGRIYGIAGLLELAKEGKYTLTKDDKDLIKKVLNLDLTVKSSSGCFIITLKYKECIDNDLLKVLSDIYKYQKENNKNKPKEIPYPGYIQDPEFTSGNLRDFFQKEIRYPDEEIKQQLNVTVVLNCMIKKDGTIGKVKVRRGISKQFDHEAIRVAKLMPKWIPGRVEGFPTDMIVPINIEFKFPISAY